MRNSFSLGGVVSWAAILFPLNADSRAGEVKESAKLISVASESTIDAGNIRYTVPFTVPTAQEILAAMPPGKRPANPQIDCKLLVCRVAEPRFYPLVGVARLVNVHFECKVVGDGRTELVYMDKDHLVRTDK